MMFKTISILTFAVLFVYLAICFLAAVCTRNKRQSSALAPMTWVQKVLVLFFTITALLFFILLVTGFFMPLVHSEHITGYWLLVHIPTSAFFAGMFILLILVTSNSNRLRISEIPVLKKVFFGKSCEIKPNFFVRICFWAMTAVFIPLTFSIILSMFEIFGTKGQILLMDIHRYSAVAFTVFFVIVLYSLVNNIRELEIWSDKDEKHC